MNNKISPPKTPLSGIIIVKENIMKKQARNDEMKRLRFEEGLTLLDISNKYNVSRERVRQIIGNTGKSFRTKWTKSQIKNHNLTGMTSMESLPGVKRVWRNLWGRFRHPISGDNRASKGARFEEKAKDILKSRGLHSRLMPTHHPFDIKLSNGYRIDVKHSDFDVSKIEGQLSASPTYPISNMKNGKDCDFFFVFVPCDDDYAVFIIPASEINTDRIRIPYPVMGRKPSKWTQWINRFDLLSNDTLT